MKLRVGDTNDDDGADLALLSQSAKGKLAFWYESG